MTRERNLVFYADHRRIVVQDHEWVQDALTVTVAIICSMVLEANLKKTKSIVCTRRFIWGKWGETAYKQRSKREEATFRKINKTQVSCTECGVTVAASNLKTYMTRIYFICVPQTRGVDEVKGRPTIYAVYIPSVLEEVKCPVLGCPSVADSMQRAPQSFHVTPLSIQGGGGPRRFETAATL